MERYKLRIKIYGEVEILADSYQHAEDALYDAIEEGTFIDIGEYRVEFVDVEIRT